MARLGSSGPYGSESLKLTGNETSLTLAKIKTQGLGLRKSRRERCDATAPIGEKSPASNRVDFNSASYPGKTTHGPGRYTAQSILCRVMRGRSSIGQPIMLAFPSLPPPARPTGASLPRCLCSAVAVPNCRRWRVCLAGPRQPHPDHCSRSRPDGARPRRFVRGC